MRKAFTLAELLICLVIIAILVALVFGGIGGCGFYKDPVTGESYYNVTNTGQYRCVKTYTVTTGSGDTTSSSKRVDLRPVDGDGKDMGAVQTFECNDDFRAGIHDSGTTFGQFETGRYYNVTSVGFRHEGWNGFFPLVKSVSEFQPKIEAEAELP